ncbi:hypothetical protein HYT56_04385 [Candidatus Woesearchaeota archaeon]|nr:hypothetical protein [Candidatus Woesearchaeota archaeon]
MGIPRNWAERTIAKFPSLRDAVIIARGYSEIPIGRYKNYFEYLDNMQARALDTSPVSAYEQEVDERTAMINPDSLVQGTYRDRPSKARDYWEQQTSRKLDT